MVPEREVPATPSSGRALARRDPQADLEELLFTLEICRRALPWDAHQAHFDRLRRIEGMVRWSLEQGERNAGHRRLGGGQGGAGGAHVG